MMNYIKLTDQTLLNVQIQQIPNRIYRQKKSYPSFGRIKHSALSFNTCSLALFLQSPLNTTTSFEQLEDRALR